MVESKNRRVVRPLAVLSVAFACAALTGCSLLGDLRAVSSADGTGTGTTTDVFAVAVGDCLNDGADMEEVSEVEIVNCKVEHDREAYKSVILTEGVFPGSDAIKNRAETDCASAFANFVGLDYKASKLGFSYYYPTEETWSQGDREILCLAVDPGGRSTGSLKGVSR